MTSESGIKNSIRLSFNTIPTTESEVTKLGLPFGCLYTPLGELSKNSKPIERMPLVCPSCKAILNPYAKIDYERKLWTCPICGKQTPLPSEYHGISEGQLTEELLPENTTVEYILENSEQQLITAPVYFFVVDMCCNEKQHQQLKTLLLQAISTIPDNAIIGFISYGTIIYVHQMVYDEIPRSFIFNGKNSYSIEDLQQKLHIGAAVTTPTLLVAPLKDIESNITTIIDQLDPDDFEVLKGERVSRCTGAAIDIAVKMLKTIFPKTGGNILVFAGGPITKGPGKMTELERKINVRSFQNLENGTAKLSNQSSTFFKELATLANSNNITINYIAASFEETGFLELEPLVSYTGGFHSIAETWGDADLLQTIVSYFSRVVPSSGTEGIVTINGSPNLSVCGQIGFGTGNPNVNGFQSHTVIGVGSTDQWHVCGLMPNSTLGLYLDVRKNGTEGQQVYIQILTRYNHVSTGKTRLRVSTQPINFSNNQQQIANGFDQEAAVSLLGRLAMNKVRTQEISKTIDELDNSFVTFCRKFAHAGQFPENMAGLPQLVYYLRRLKVFTTQNSTPDLTCSIRSTFNRLDADSTALLLVPVLNNYSVNQEQPQEVALSLDSLNQDSVLVLTSFNRVVVWVGRNMAVQRNNGNQSVKDLIEKATQIAQTYANERFPAPQVIVCDQDSSPSRYLLAAINPPAPPASPKAPPTSLSTNDEEFGSFLHRLTDLTK